MAIAVRGTISGAGFATGKVSVSATAGWTTSAPQAGDVLVAFVFVDGGIGDPTSSTSGLFTNRVDVSLPGWGADAGSWTRAFNVADSSYEWDCGFANTPITVVVIALSGADAAIIDGTPSGTAFDFGGTSNPMTAPSVTGLTRPDGLLLTAFVAAKNTSAPTFTTPTGTTAQASQQNALGFTKGTVAAFSLALASSSNTATQSSTVSAAYNEGAALSIVVKAASASVDGTMSTVVGTATADGGSSTFTGDGTFTSLVADATASGGISTFTGDPVTATPQLGSGGTVPELGAPTTAQLDDDLLLL